MQTNELGENIPRWEMDIIWNIQGMDRIREGFAEVIEVINGRVELDTTSLGYSTRHLSTRGRGLRAELPFQRLQAGMSRPEDVGDARCQRYIRLSG